MQPVTGPADLLLALEPLLPPHGDPWAHLDVIRKLLAQAGNLAEVEVARAWVTRAMAPRIDELAHSRNSEERFRALELASELFSAADLAQLMRRMVRDPVHGVRLHARRLMFRARFTDVALPDHRFQAPLADSRARWPYPLGGFNASGWSAGLKRDARMSSRYNLVQRLRSRPGTVGNAAARNDARARIPRIEDVDALAELLGIEDGEDGLTRLFRPGAGPGAAYVEFDVPKATGGMRRLAAPRAALKAVQRRILAQILAPLPVHPACQAYARGCSLVTNSAPHVGAAVVIKTDLRDFFPSIHYRRVFGLFSYYGYSSEVAAALAKLTTYQPVLEDGTVVRPGVLPQGAPTSPAIANLVCRQLDARLSGLAARVGARYTRYADDLTFSFVQQPEVPLGRFFWWVDQIAAQEGFLEHYDKRRVLRSHQRQLVTGVVVNSGQSVPRDVRRRFRALLHHLGTRGVDQHGRTAESLRAYCFGVAAYVKMVQPELGEALMSQVRALYQR